nr:MAG TPA: hypothetical protein [Caudoviricetes sp.]
MGKNIAFMFTCLTIQSMKNGLKYSFFTHFHI